MQVSQGLDHSQQNGILRDFQDCSHARLLASAIWDPSSGGPR